METLRMTLDEFEYLRALQIKRRWDWPAIFSTNCHGNIWPRITNGYTRQCDREDVRGLSPIIDQVADIYTNLRSDGGRFFIGNTGAFYKDSASQLVPILTFEIVVSKRTA